jgi:hypothetical protein
METQEAMTFFLDLIGANVGGAIGDAFTVHQTRPRVPSDGQVDCGIRLVSGRQPGITREWTYGRAALEPGAITLDGSAIPIEEVVGSSRRPAFIGETRFRVPSQVVQLRSDTAVLELTLATSLMAWAITTMKAES